MNPKNPFLHEWMKEGVSERGMNRARPAIFQDPLGEGERDCVMVEYTLSDRLAT